MMKFSFLAILIMALMSCNNASKTTVRVHLDKPQGEIKPQLITKDSTYALPIYGFGFDEYCPFCDG